MTILVLGATGNTGAEVVKQLQAKGASFLAMVRNLQSASRLGLAPAQIRVGDFYDVASLVQAMQGVSSVYLAMAAHPDNRQWVSNVLEAMKRSGASHLVKLSGMGAAETAGSEIIRTHAQTDRLVLSSGLTYTLLQPNSFYQNLFASVESIKATGQFFLPLREARQSVVDIRDVAAVAVAALTELGHDNKTYQLSGPEALTFSEQAAILSELAGKSIRYVAVSRSAAEQAMLAAGMDAWLAERLAEILDWFAEGHYDEVTDDVETVLGRPARTFRAFAEEMVSLVK